MRIQSAVDSPPGTSPSTASRPSSPRNARSRQETTFAIVSNDLTLRGSLAIAIGDQQDFRLTGAYDDLPSALADTGFTSSGAVLLEVPADSDSRFGDLRHLRALQPELPIVAIIAFGETKLITEALESGATGYLLKQAPPAGIAEALREALADCTSVASSVARPFPGSLLPGLPAAKPGSTLTRREHELVTLLAKRLRYHEIAIQMGVSLNTVRYYVRRAYGKLRAQSRTEALKRYQGRF